MTLSIEEGSTKGRPSQLAAWLSLLLVVSTLAVIIVVVSGGVSTTPQLGNATSTSTSTALLVAEVSHSPSIVSSGSPTATIALGMLGFCLRITDFHGPLCTTNMWRGIINGDVIQVMGGQEVVDGDWEQGIAIVKNLSQHDDHVYKTTQRAGPVRIVAVNGTRVTFALLPINLPTPDVWLTPWTAATPGTTYVLDLVSRQWISPPPSFTPVPTPTWGSGMVPCFGSGWGRGWWIADNSCWQGMIDGCLVEVITGREVGVGGTDAGFLSVYSYDPKDRTELNYQRQDMLASPLIIASVQGTLVYLEGGDTFDIKGWLPGGTATPTPYRR